MMCVACKSGFSLLTDSHTCVEQCPSGYFKNSEGNCDKCDTNCIECELTSSNCLKCSSSGREEESDESANYKDDESGEERAIVVLQHNRCVYVNKTGEECALGTYYERKTGACETCDISCSSCVRGGESGCSACNDERRPYIDPEGRCVAECDLGFYLNRDIKTCVKCPIGCLLCDDSNKCQKCDAGFGLIDDVCEPKPRFNDDDCKDNNCLECYGKGENECLVCKNGLSLLSGKCVEEAPQGYFKQESNTNRGIMRSMEKCSLGCLKCSSKEECTLCSSKYRLIHGSCELKCDSGFYANKDDSCEACRSECRTCLNETFCLTCSDPNKFYLNGKCLESCPDGYFPNKDSLTCDQCHYSCETCQANGAKNCLSCPDGFNYTNNECKSLCPDSTYFDKETKQCSICSSACLWCIRSADKCIKCPSPLALDLASNQCKPCCSRSLHGTLKSPTCCNCLNGVCSKDKFADNGIYESETKPSNAKLAVLIVLLVVSVVFFLFSLFFVRRSLLKKNNIDHQNVKYSALLEDN